MPEKFAPVDQVVLFFSTLNSKLFPEAIDVVVYTHTFPVVQVIFAPEDQLSGDVSPRMYIVLP